MAFSLAGIERLGFRVIHGAGAEGFQFAADEEFVALLKVVSHVRHVPPSAMQAPRAVIEHEFEH
jgi:hypothetical protein